MTLKKLSEQATPGEWGLFDDRGTLEIGHAEKPGERPCIIGWPGFDSTDKPMAERRANAKFIVALVNAYRAGEVVAASPEEKPIGPYPGYRAQIIEECIAACDSERLQDPHGTEGDTAYTHAIDDCVAAIRSLVSPLGTPTGCQHRWIYVANPTGQPYWQCEQCLAASSTDPMPSLFAAGDRQTQEGK